MAKEGNRSFTTRGWKFSYISLQDLLPDGDPLEKALERLNRTVSRGLKKIDDAKRGQK